MRRLWDATEEIRYIMICFLIISIGLIWIVGCGSSNETPAQGGVAIETKESEEPEVTWSEEVATWANNLCASRGGVQELVPNLEEGWTENFVVVVCQDGDVLPGERR